MGAIAQGISEVRQKGREVARYRVPGGQRVVFAHEVAGGRELVDVPASGIVGQLFTVDSCWRNEWTLASFLARYTALGEQLGCCPVIPGLEDELDDEEFLLEELEELYWQIGRS
jgi:hypothetical protein